ncbi:MAG: alanine racemase [Ruminococcaceae bacterium]|nr:alanine racemase [Oscillospiraceae bacterium]
MTTPLCNAYLEIDMPRLRRNVRAIAGSLPAGTALIAVLKDDAYGLGQAAVGGMLADMPEVSTLAVAHVAEGLALREAGVKKEILVMGGAPGFLLVPALECGLTLPLWRPGVAPQLGAWAAEQGVHARVEIKLETGLNRVGFAPGAELDGLLQELAPWREHLHITGAFSHFANTADAAFTEWQYQAFLAGVAQLEKAGIPVPRRHISSSASSELYPQYHLDAVRLGRRLYMDNPENPLGGIEEVPSWRSWVTAVRTLPAGQALGYGRRFRLKQDTEVATVGVGYGDGLNQRLVQVGAPVLVRGHMARLLACTMDQCFLDVTGLACRPDDEVTFFGRDSAGKLLSSQAVALLAGGDEGCGLTAALVPRVARVYKD